MGSFIDIASALLLVYDRPPMNSADRIQLKIFKLSVEIYGTMRSHTETVNGTRNGCIKIDNVD